MHFTHHCPYKVNDWHRAPMTGILGPLVQQKIVTLHLSTGLVTEVLKTTAARSHLLVREQMKPTPGTKFSTDSSSSSRVDGQLFDREDIDMTLGPIQPPLCPRVPRVSTQFWRLRCSDRFSSVDASCTTAGQPYTALHPCRLFLPVTCRQKESSAPAGRVSAWQGDTGVSGSICRLPAWLCP